MKVITSEGSDKYHAINTLTKDSYCGTLKDGIIMSREKAEEMGKEACKRQCSDKL